VHFVVYDKPCTFPGSGNSRHEKGSMGLLRILQRAMFKNRRGKMSTKTNGLRFKPGQAISKSVDATSSLTALQSMIAT